MNKESFKNLKKLLPLSLCCIIPILILLAVPTISLYSPKIALSMSFIAPFICPLVMGGAFLFVFKGNKSCCNKSESSSN